MEVTIYSLLQEQLYFFFGVVFIVHNVPFIVCVTLRAVICLSVVCYFV
jgi:hypothetical protein